MFDTIEEVSIKQHTLQLTKNIVQFRKGFVNVVNSKKDNSLLAMSVASEFLQFGYVFSPEVIKHLSCALANDIVKFHDEVTGYLKKMTGSNRNYAPFWPGFPQQVMEKSEFELWLHQIVHYCSNGTYMPDEWTQQRAPAFEQPKYTIINVGTEKDFESIFTDLVSVNQSLTPDDLEIVKWFAKTGQKLVFPEKIPFKENLCTLAFLKLDVPVKTVTDVLRIAVGMSGGDISLPKIPKKRVKLSKWTNNFVYNPLRENFKFAKFNRKDRKFLLGLLEKTNCDETEAVLKAQRWIRLGEKLRPGDYKTKFPNAYNMFSLLRNAKVQSWYGKVQAAFFKSFEQGLEVLAERPGEFTRRLDYLLRKHSDKNKRLVLDKFKSIAGKVSNKVLFETFTHFQKRLSPITGRVIMTKGSRKATKLPDLPAIDRETVLKVQEIVKDALEKSFSSLPKMKKVYLDENLKKIPLPTNMRSSSSSLRPIIRGERMPIGNKNAKVIRAFVHWYDEQGNQDIDLTVTLIGMGKLKHIGWNGTHNGVFGTYSGDVRHKQGPCAEYVDIKLEECLKEGFKYAVVDARNYNGRSFETVTDCVVGYMEREFAIEGEVFIPSTIANCMRLTNEESTTIVSIIDLQSQEYIHLDIDQNGLPVASANFDSILDVVKQYSEKPVFSVYDLISLHVNARKGKIVSLQEQAEQCFTFEDFSASYIETLKLMGI